MADGKVNEEEEMSKVQQMADFWRTPSEGDNVWNYGGTTLTFQCEDPDQEEIFCGGFEFGFPAPVPPAGSS